MRDVEIPKWLEGLPLAPEFRPTDTEFADPIAYISKIEKQASAFGICKVIPPLPKPSKKYVLYNLNRALSKCPELGSDLNSKKMVDVIEGSNGSEVRAAFTTRHQELGQSGKGAKGTVGSQSTGAQKQVWQSGEVYTLEQFEAKSKTFAKSQLGAVKEVSPLVVETMFWEVASDKPIYVEYANDVPGSGFGEPEGSFRYFNRRRRRRRKRGAFDRNNQENSCSMNAPVAKNSSTVNNSSVDKDADVTDLCKQQSPISSSLPSTSSGQSENFYEGKLPNANDEMHGTAGWKLANSPWNLQVIARSPGSLTRYMPDDIPGVTSPMIYIGMLFSWFAWHVEDHELHSLNFLHMGSPKTWYSVPGDFAFAFEEVIRVHAYGGSTNPLDALTVLGEKTTLVSPEVIVASGIPCCRLVQNPGEFVVTFPRAYHVGFSHGFNCGEAANFSTPKWLTFAKEAAVRRAAMNYLPMLSHQQLLYLLTMSFISRVPRSLLPGARSSRLKDRQKEERELEVKKAFIEDILKENRLLTMLLQKNSSYRVVLWNLDLLPALIKDSKVCSATDSVGPRTEENCLSDKYNIEDLYMQMNLYMDSAADFYVDDVDDLQNDYQVDSGTLPCVACGILGFPFMAVVQPSEQALRDLLLESRDLVPQIGVSHPMGSETGTLIVGAETSALASSTVEQEKSCNFSTGYARPRVFCLEHAIQTVELLGPKGGANALGICHSDFQKIKAHSSVVAEEISWPFTYNEIPLENASEEDLYLIDHAIDNQEKDECMKDWTSELNINMQHCVKMRKFFPSLKVKHALPLDGLFSDTVLTANAFKWQSRKTRSKRSLNPPILNKPSLSFQTEKVEKPVVKVDGEIGRQLGQVTIQYYRKRYKSNPCSFEGVSGADSDKQHIQDDLVAEGVGYSDIKRRDMSGNALVRIKDARNLASCSSFTASFGKSLMQSEDQVTMCRGDLSENPTMSKLVDSSVNTTLLAETVDGHYGKNMLEELIEINGNCDSPRHDCKKPPNIHVVERTAENHESVNCKNSTVSLCTSFHGNENSEVLEEKIVSETGHENGMSDLIDTDSSRRQCEMQADEDVLLKDAPSHSNLSPCADYASGERCNEQKEPTVVDKCGMDDVLVDHSTGNFKVQKEIQATEGKDEESSVPLSSLGEEVASPGEIHKQQQNGSQSSLLHENKQLDEAISAFAQLGHTEENRRKRKLLLAQNEDPPNIGCFSRSPCEGLRPRAKSNALANVTDDKKKAIEDKEESRKVNRHFGESVCNKDKEQKKFRPHKCDVEGCRMSFQTKAELALHLQNRCPVKGCGKKFNSHKYAILHQRVHDDERPLKCPWKGCTMTFKWAWARTEHIRVHTGERPYKCQVEGCGLTFRFVSDFSRHRRKSGHYVN